MCDPWWENQTEWHRAWKNQFPVEWHEVWHTAGDGERHIADVKTDRDWVIEFQHSYLKPEERRSRDAFYQKLIWVVDGTRRKRDEAQFRLALSEGRRAGLWRRIDSDGCALLREWAGSSAIIFLDFGEELWWLFAPNTDGWAYVAQVPRVLFVESHRGTAIESARQFDQAVNNMTNIPTLFAVRAPPLSAQPLVRDPLQLPRPRRRFRF